MMEVRGEVLLLIVLSAAVTLSVRVLPFLTAHRLRLSPLAVAWFRLLPPAVLAALLLPELLLPGGRLITTLWSPDLMAAAISVAIALKTRSIMLTIIAGMASYSMLSALMQYVG